MDHLSKSHSSVITYNGGNLKSCLSFIIRQTSCGRLYFLPVTTEDIPHRQRLLCDIGMCSRNCILLYLDLIVEFTENGSLFTNLKSLAFSCSKLSIYHTTRTLIIYCSLLPIFSIWICNHSFCLPIISSSFSLELNLKNISPRAIFAPVNGFT